MNLQPQADRVLVAIDAYQKVKGYAPSRRELMELAGLASTSVVTYWIRELVRRRLLEAPRYTSRALVITPEGYFYLSARQVAVA